MSAFGLVWLAKKYSPKAVHVVCLIMAGVGLLIFPQIENKYLLFAPMTGFGIAWASILSVPYAMLSGSLPPEKMGYYMGVFNFFIVIPQIIAGTVLGFLLKHLFNNEPIYILVTGGVSMIIAGLLCLKVADADEVVIKS